MSNIWERFETIVNKEEVETAKAQFSPIEEGQYKAILEEIAPAENKDGLPMIKGKLRLVGNNRVVFYNQMLQNLNYPNLTAVNIAEAVNFISGLLGEEVEFESLPALADLIYTIPIGNEYTVQVTYGKKDTEMKFPKLKIVESEINYDAEFPNDGDIPF